MTKEKQFLPGLPYHFVALPYCYLVTMFYIICCACQVLLKSLILLLLSMSLWLGAAASKHTDQST